MAERPEHRNTTYSVEIVTVRTIATSSEAERWREQQRAFAQVTRRDR